MEIDNVNAGTKYTVAPWLVEQGFLPTQVAIGEGESRS